MEIKINKFLPVLVGLVLQFATSNAYSHSTGMKGYTGNPLTHSGESCNFCHNQSPGANPPTVIITGPENTVSNSINNYILTLTGSPIAIAGFQDGAGLNIGVTDGELVAKTSGTNTTTSSLASLPMEIQHNGTFPIGADGTVSWKFDWIAPATEGTYSFYAAAISAVVDKDPVTDRTATTVFTVTVAREPKKPTLIIKAPYTAQIGEEVTFDASGSTATGGNIVEYTWDFGSTLKSKSISKFIFDTVGVQTVNLIAVTDSGLSSSSFIDIEIVNISKGGKLVPIAKIAGPSTAKTNTTITFDAGLSSPSTNVQFIWDFGDGSVLTTDATVTTVDHIYNSAKTYIVGVAVKDGTTTGIATTTITISDPVTLPPPVQRTGASVYKTECESCHGVNGIGISTVGGAKRIVGATVLLIDNTISTTVPTMSTISLQGGDSQLLANFLSANSGTTGDTIFRTKCELCHGVAGIGALAKNIENAKQQIILNAVNQTATPVIPLMLGIVLSSSDATLIEKLLTTVTGPVETGQTLYEQECKICHGSAGAGGSAKLIVNASLNMIDTAITNIAAMGSIPEIKALTTVQRQKIVDYLASGIVVPGDSTKGEKVYIAKCQKCHGTGEGGLAVGILNVSSIMIDNAIINIPLMQAIVLDTVTNEKQNLVAMLALGPITKPTSDSGLFKMYCSFCHGLVGDGVGGFFPNASVKTMLLPVTAKIILDAYSGGEPEMSKSKLIDAGLTLSDRQAMANWLK